MDAARTPNDICYFVRVDGNEKRSNINSSNQTELNKTRKGKRVRDPWFCILNLFSQFNIDDSILLIVYITWKKEENKIKWNEFLEEIHQYSGKSRFSYFCIVNSEENVSGCVQIGALIENFCFKSNMRIFFLVTHTNVLKFLLKNIQSSFNVQFTIRNSKFKTFVIVFKVSVTFI